MQCRCVKNIEAPVDDGGDIAFGATYPIKCAATAADSHNSVGMLVRREGETLNALPKWRDRVIGQS